MKMKAMGMRIDDTSFGTCEFDDQRLLEKLKKLPNCKQRQSQWKGDVDMRDRLRHIARESRKHSHREMMSKS